jgi:hypothetical protein
MSDLCARLHREFQQSPVFSFPFEDSAIPLNGIYVLYEAGETAHGGNRVVRVGTHTGKNQLRSRLKQHFVNEHKDRSIFRKNIGRALLNRDNDPFLDQWEVDLTTSEAKRKHGPAIDRARQSAVEHMVTEVIQKRFHFAVFRVDEKDKRLELEARMIATISRCEDCGPSQQWLGLHSPKTKIRNSGLWLVNELYGEPFSETGFVEQERAVRQSQKGEHGHPMDD